jgi:hypothetical protein
VNPGREYIEPRVYQQPTYDYDSEPHQVNSIGSHRS